MKPAAMRRRNGFVFDEEYTTGLKENASAVPPEYQDDPDLYYAI